MTGKIFNIIIYFYIKNFNFKQRYDVDFENNVIMLPKIGEVKAVLHRYLEGNLKTATISKSSSGRYFISILVDDRKEIPDKQINI